MSDQSPAAQRRRKALPTLCHKCDQLYGTGWDPHETCPTCMAKIESRALIFEPFSDDPGPRVLTDHFRTCNQAHPDGCFNCGCGVARGERARCIVAIVDDAVRCARFCWKCCVAMAKSSEDEGRDWCARYEMGCSRGS